MSVTLSAYCIVGVRVDREDFKRVVYQEQTVPGCEHLLPDFILKDPAMKYCPICRKPLRAVKHKAIEAYDEGSDQLKGYGVYMPEHPNYARVVYIASQVVTHPGELLLDQADVRALDEERSAMREDLQPLGLWNDTFGIHLVAYLS